MGRRGYFLLTLALVCATYGWAFVDSSDPVRKAQNAYLAQVIPIDSVTTSWWVWAVLWWVTGLVCLVDAFRTDDHLAYGLVASLMAAWAVTNGWAALEGMPNGVTRAIVWAFIASAVLVISTWPEQLKLLQELSAGEVPEPDAGERGPEGSDA